MGLCKCPRKKVTNLFCFEHRVNVCEHCLVGSHGACVVQSYLAWLQDSDYDANCSLCGLGLTESGDPVRLLCLHLFHWRCLERWGAAFPATTAPAGFRCPLCQDPLFPKPNATSPIVDALRSRLAEANWARAGLGLPFLPGLRGTSQPSPGPHYHPSPTPTPHATALHIPDSQGPTTTTRKAVHPAENEAAAASLLGGGGRRDADLAENKYRRRSATEWLGGLIRSRQTRPGGDPLAGGRRILCYLLLILVALGVLVAILNRAARSEDLDEDEPLMDPLGQPQLPAGLAHPFDASEE